MYLYFITPKGYYMKKYIKKKKIVYTKRCSKSEFNKVHKQKGGMFGLSFDKNIDNKTIDDRLKNLKKKYKKSQHTTSKNRR